MGWKAVGVGGGGGVGGMVWFPDLFLTIYKAGFMRKNGNQSPIATSILSIRVHKGAIVARLERSSHPP